MRRGLASHGTAGNRQSIRKNEVSANSVCIDDVSLPIHEIFSAALCRHPRRRRTRCCTPSGRARRSRWAAGASRPTPARRRARSPRRRWLPPPAAPHRRSASCAAEQESAASPPPASHAVSSRQPAKTSAYPPHFVLVEGMRRFSFSYRAEPRARHGTGPSSAVRTPIFGRIYFFR